MKTARGLYLCVSLLAVVLVCTSVWAFDIYLYVDGIPGEATDASHTDWINAYSFYHLIQNAGPSSSYHNAFGVTKYLDKATPLLFLRACDGQHINNVVIDVWESSKQVYEVTLYDVTVSQIDSDGNTTNGLPSPVETVEFSYGQIQWKYLEYDTGGGFEDTHIECWNVTNAAPCP